MLTAIRTLLNVILLSYLTSLTKLKKIVSSDKDLEAIRQLKLTFNEIEQMNGSIGFESEEGKGSRFWIEVPLS